MYFCGSRNGWDDNVRGDSKLTAAMTWERLDRLTCCRTLRSCRLQGFELVVSLKTAMALGIGVSQNPARDFAGRNFPDPPTWLVRADEAIE